MVIYKGLSFLFGSWKLEIIIMIMIMKCILNKSERVRRTKKKKKETREEKRICEQEQWKPCQFGIWEGKL